MTRARRWRPGASPGGTRSRRSSSFAMSSASRQAEAGSSCPVHLDAWSHHPYTNGGPFTKQGSPDGVSMGDLPKMRKTLTAAAVCGNALPAKASIPLWVSEFSWDTDGPDPDAVPMALHARWVSEALYQAWRSGVTLFVWHQLRDRPFPSTQYQSGLYYCGRSRQATTSAVVVPRAATTTTTRRRSSPSSPFASRSSPMRKTGVSTSGGGRRTPARHQVASSARSG